MVTTNSPGTEKSAGAACVWMTLPSWRPARRTPPFRSSPAPIMPTVTASSKPARMRRCPSCMMLPTVWWKAPTGKITSWPIPTIDWDCKFNNPGQEFPRAGKTYGQDYLIDHLKEFLQLAYIATTSMSLTAGFPFRENGR